MTLSSSLNAQSRSSTDPSASDPQSSPDLPAVERFPGGIIHFDATQIRRNRLRSESTRNGTIQPTKPSAEPVKATMKSEPVDFEAPTESTSEPAPSEPAPSEPAPSEWWERVMREFSDSSEPAISGSSTAAAVTPPDASCTLVSPPAVTASMVLSPIDSDSAPPSELASAGQQASKDELQSFLVNFVVEQTGYPEEIVELDADLEADLGIDSIKKAQMFGEIAEFYGLQPDENLSIDDFTTLQSVLDYLVKTVGDTNSAASSSATLAAPLKTNVYQPSFSGNGHTPPGQPAAPSAPAVAKATPLSVIPADNAAPSLNDLRSFLVNFVVEQTGYPEEIVEMDADLEADLGIDSIKKAQMFGEIGEYFGLTPDENLSLDDFPTLADVLKYLQQNVD